MQGGGGGGEIEGDRGSAVDSELIIESPVWGSNSLTVRSGPEPELDA